MLSISLPAAPRLFWSLAAAVRWLASSTAWSGSSSSRGAIAIGASSSGTGSSFGWDGVFRIAADGGDDPSDLRGYFERVRSSNRGAEFRSEFVPFVIKEQVAGYIHIRDVHTNQWGAEDCVWEPTLYPVTPSHSMPVFFSLEQAAAPYFCIKSHPSGSSFIHGHR